MENVMDQRMQVLSNIQTEAIHWVIDQMTQNNARFLRQVEYLTRVVRSMVGVKTAPTWTPQ